jgi:hypothetical protein
MQAVTKTYEADTQPWIDTVLTAGRTVMVVLLIAVSPLALYKFGWQYYDTGGSPLEKFHPATLISIALVLVMSLRFGNPLSGLAAILDRHMALIPYLLANVFMLAYASIILKLPVTIFIETFIGAALIFVVFHDTDEREASRLAWLIHALLFLNALLGFYEVAAGFRLTPLVVNGEDLLDEPRATAILGHPLSNAMVMGGYVIMMALGGGRDLPVAMRAVCFLTALASLVPFGGRAASAATLAILLFLALKRGVAILQGDSFDPRSVLAGLIVVPLACLGLIAAYEMGLFDTLASRLFDDEGSAGTRIEMFALFRYLSTYDLIFGPDPDMLMTWVRLHGLTYGIESFIVAFVLNYGLMAAILFFPTLAIFFYHLRSSLRPGAGLAIIYFLAVALTSISLSSKSPTLSVFVMILTVLLRPPYPDTSSRQFGE